MVVEENVHRVCRRQISRDRYKVVLQIATIMDISRITYLWSAASENEALYWYDHNSSVIRCVKIGGDEGRLALGD